MSKSLFFSFLMVLFFVTLNPANAAPRKGEDPRMLDKSFAEAAGLVCGSGHNTIPAVGNYDAGDSFCIGGLSLGKTISQSSGFGPGSKGEENLVDFLTDIPEDADLIIGCTNDEIVEVGCQNGLHAKANACAVGMAAARCQNAFNIALQANPSLFGRTTQVLSGIRGVRQVVFLVKKRPVAPAPGSERCSADEIAAAAKIKLAGDHTEAFKARVVVMIEGQRLPTGVVERVVTLTIPGHDEAGKGFIVRHPEQVKSCRVGLVKEGSLPPDPPAGVPQELRPTPAPAPEPERETACNNGLDDDGDGKIDCADSDCADHAAVCVKQPEICDDGIDNDRDGFVDKDDSDCLTPVPPKPLKLNLIMYLMGYIERPPREEFRHMEDPGLEWKNYANPQVGLGVPFVTGGMVIIPSLIVAMRTTEYTEFETTGPLLGDRHAWVVGGEISLLKKVGKDLWAGLEPGFYYGQNGADPYLNGKIQLQVTPRVGVAVVLGLRYVENHVTEEAVFIPRLGLQLSFSLDPIFQ
jgi:hypothetical protein